MKKSCLLLLVLPLMLSGCGKSEPTPEPTPGPTPDPHDGEPDKKGTYHVEFESMLLKDETENLINLGYDYPCSTVTFENKSSEFNKDIALASFAFAVSAPEKATINKVYDAYGFSNIVNSSDYDVVETKQSVKYTFGSKKVGEDNLIAVSISGMRYFLPWQSNLEVGEEGDHYGFNEGATKVLDALNSYLKDYPDIDKTKIWINGYSRSSAIGQIVSYQLLEQELVLEDNLYAYFFETPRGVMATNEKEYKSIFNILNSGDLVTYVAPSVYGLKRIGTDIDIYNKDADNIVTSFNSKLALSPFTANESAGYLNESGFNDFIINTLTGEYESEDDPDFHDLSTRDRFANYYQEDFAYLLSLALSLKPETTSAVKEAFDKLNIVDKALLILDETGVYNFLKPIFDRTNQPYDDEMLKSSTVKLVAFAKKSSIISKITSSDFQNTALRSIQLHAPETVLPLLVDYLSK